ncbi:MAG: thioesterase [Eubacteriales bacterium]|nr:thioesterase [Eubacteriales bacterium]
MTEQLTRTMTLRACNCDSAGRWKPSDILLEMQEAGEDHSAVLGFSRPFLVSNGMCWVLSRLSVAMDEYPVYGQEVCVTTWASPVQGLYFPRHYSFTRPDGTPLGCASTLWVLFQVEDRHLLRPSALPGELRLGDRPAPMPAPGKLHLEGVTPVGQRMVCYSDLDFNGHMNNARYADWICDLAEFDRLSKGGLSAWQINFVNEGRPGEVIDLSAGRSPQGMVIHGQKADGKTMFEAELRYRAEN